MQFPMVLVKQMLATALVVCLVLLMKQMLSSWHVTRVVIYTGQWEQLQSSLLSQILLLDNLNCCCAMIIMQVAI